MNKKLDITLKPEERQELEELVSKGKHAARVQRRARILLLSDHSQPDPRNPEAISQALLCSRGTVYNIKHRYIAGGLATALHDKPKPGAKPKITGDVEAHLIALTCSDPPEGYARWTLRLLADQLVELELVESISHVAIGEVLKKTNSSPGG